MKRADNIMTRDQRQQFADRNTYFARTAGSAGTVYLNNLHCHHALLLLNNLAGITAVVHRAPRGGIDSRTIPCPTRGRDKL